MPTIHEVARTAGVGVGTASRALNGNPHVSDATRLRVNAVAEQLGFRPSRIARAFSRGRTDTVQVIVPLLTQHFYVEVLRGIESALAETELTLLIRTIERRADRLRLLTDADLRRRADGVLLVSVMPGRGLISRVTRASLPAVLVNAEHPRFSGVSVDHTAAAAAAVRHLLDLGHRRIALVDHFEDPFAAVYPDARQRGYRLALAEADVAPRPAYELVTDFTPRAGAAALGELLRLPEPPTAVFVGSDTQAIGILDAAGAAGRRIPDDLAVVGYNDIEVAAYLDLTTVHVPMRELGRRGLQLLVHAIDEPEAPLEHVRLPAQLVVRGSSGANVLSAT